MRLQCVSCRSCSAGMCCCPFQHFRALSGGHALHGTQSGLQGFVGATRCVTHSHFRAGCHAQHSGRSRWAAVAVVWSAPLCGPQDTDPFGNLALAPSPPISATACERSHLVPANLRHFTPRLLQMMKNANPSCCEPQAGTGPHKSARVPRKSDPIATPSRHCEPQEQPGGHALRGTHTLQGFVRTMHCVGRTDSHISICRENSVGGSGCRERAIVWAARHRPIWQPRSGSVSTNFRHCL